MGRSTTIKYVGFGLVALSFGIAACASDDSGSSNNNGNGSGTGGLISGDGGGTATGGAPGVTGGAPGTGGVIGNTGGSAPVTIECPPAGADFATDGYASNGTLCGYVFTGSWDGATVEPPCGTSECFMGTNTCATGEIAASDDDAKVYPGILVGMNVAQNNMGQQGTWTMTGSGITFNFTATGAAAVRGTVQVGETSYCKDGITSGTPIPWSEFTYQCWQAGGNTLPAGAAVKAVLLEIPSADMAQSVEVCLNGVTVN